MKRVSQDLGLDAMTMGAPPAPAGPPAPTFQIIYSPLDNMGKILADLDFKTFLQGNFNKPAKDLALEVWEMYGGDEDGINAYKEGRRKNKPFSDDMMKQQNYQEDEYNRTRETRWERLPVGKTIADITNTQELESAIAGGFNFISKPAKPAAASVQSLIKTANIADQVGQYKEADRIMEKISNVYTLK